VRLTYIYDHSFNVRMDSTMDELTAAIKARTGATEVVDASGGTFAAMCEKIDAEKKPK
jgi:hypothetical protein